MFLPRPYPDELIGSVLARASVHTGLPLAVLSRQVLGRRSAQVSFFLPSGIATLARMTRMDGDELVARHTVFPYVTAFMAAHEVRTIRRKVLAPPTHENGSIAALVKSVTQGTQAFRLCEACVRDDMAKFGEAYWHRSHFVPGVYQCSAHGVSLLQVLELPTVRRGPALELADMPSLRACAVGPFPNSALRDRLASLSLSTFSDGWCHRDDWLGTYRGQALAKGYSAFNGDVMGRQLALDLASQFGQTFLKALCCFEPPQASDAWPSLMIRPRTRIRFSPVKHALLGAFLSISGNEPNKFSYQSPGMKAEQAALRDEAWARTFAQAWKEGERNQLRLSMRSVFEAQGIWSAYRHERTLYPKTQAVIQAFKRSEQAERQTGRRHCWRKRPELETPTDGTSCAADRTISSLLDAV